MNLSAKIIQPSRTVLSTPQNLNSSQTMHLRKAIQIKNKNIDDLIKELKETNQIYLQYKNQYFQQESKLKSKINQLSKLLTNAINQQEILKEAMKTQRDQMQHIKEQDKKIIKDQGNKINQLTSQLNAYQIQFQDKNKEISALKQKNQAIFKKCRILQENNRKMQGECQLYRQQVTDLRQQIQRIKKINILKQEEKQQTTRERKVQAKKKMEAKLLHLEQKIKTTMQNI